MPLFLIGALKWLAGVPWWVWAIVAAVLYGGYEFHDYGDRRYAEGRSDEKAIAVKAQQRADALATAELADLQRQVDTNRDHAQAMLEAEVHDAATKLAALKGAFPSYVTPTQLARCDDVPRGLLRYGADLAAFANGGDPAGPLASAAADDSPSGVSVPALADALAGQADAYRACRVRVTAWERHATDLNRWCSAVIDILQAKPPS